MSSVAAPAVDNAYDVIPYHDHPYPFTHPRHLETLAALFGMSPAPADRCRVLELGCAGGGNIIPMAAAAPESTFLGIDLSERQIARGRQTVAELGLSNVELLQANILDIADDWGTVDYIIAHGIYSWIPREVQDKLLDICGRSLAPHGVAIVSYNTYPGWHLGNVARDLMRYHASGFPTAEAKIIQAKAVLEFLAELSPGHSAMSALLKDELETLKQVNDDAYLFHEHLEANNEPVYFHQFMARALAAGLQYLAEAEFSTMVLGNLPPKARDALARLPILQQEQYMDFVRGRRFRKTLLCHASLPLSRNLSCQAMPRFHFSLPGPVEAKHVDIRTEEAAEFRWNGSSMRTTGRLVKAAMMHLAEKRPEAVSFEELYATAVARVQAARPVPPDDPSLAADGLGGGLLTGFTVNLVELSLRPRRCVARVSERPESDPLARLQAAHGPAATSRRHDLVRLDAVQRHLLQQLDGRRDHGTLARGLQEAIAAGTIEIRNRKGPLHAPTPEMVRSVAEQALAYLAQAALLVA